MSTDVASAEAWFTELWQRLAAFARAEPDAFRFLEMQDHVEYLDAKSRALELSVLAPLWLAGKRLRDRIGGPPVDIAIALLWGAFVGLVKASRLGYLPLDDKKLAQAGAAAWRLIAPISQRSPRRRLARTATKPRRPRKDDCHAAPHDHDLGRLRLAPQLAALARQPRAPQRPTSSMRCIARASVSSIDARR